MVDFLSPLILLFLFDELRLYLISTSFFFFSSGFRFIFVFLGVGIVVCLSTVGGHIIAHCISSSTLFLVSFLLKHCFIIFEDCLRNFTIHYDIISILDLNLVYCCRLLPSFPWGNIARRDFLQDGLGKGIYTCLRELIWLIYKIDAFSNVIHYMVKAYLDQCGTQID